MPATLHTPKTQLSPESEKRIQRHIAGLEKRLVNFRAPQITLTIRNRPTEHRHTADLRVHLGVDELVLVSHQSGETADLAAKLAVEDVERQLERHVATLRGEPAYGTPSRREPRDLRPAARPGEPKEPEEPEAADLADEDDYDAPPLLSSR